MQNLSTTTKVAVVGFGTALLGLGYYYYFARSDDDEEEDDEEEKKTKKKKKTKLVKSDKDAKTKPEPELQSTYLNSALCKPFLASFFHPSDA
jgi:hypothetical protein